MKLDLNGYYSPKIDEYLKEADKKRISDEAIERYGSYYDLTIGNFSQCVDGDFSKVVGDKVGDITGTWLQVYWMRGFASFVKEYVDTLVKLSPKMDADEEQAASGLMETTLVESMLVFSRGYFGLHSFSETENKITLGEVLIAKKAVYNDVMFRKKLSKIQLAKVKKK